jgi:hypothetical protein
MLDGWKLAGAPSGGLFVAADLIRRMAGRYRLPDALRRADTLARHGPPREPAGCTPALLLGAGDRVGCARAWPGVTMDARA